MPIRKPRKVRTVLPTKTPLEEYVAANNDAIIAELESMGIKPSLTLDGKELLNRGPLQCNHTSIQIMEDEESECDPPEQIQVCEDCDAAKWPGGDWIPPFSIGK